MSQYARIDRRIIEQIKIGNHTISHMLYFRALGSEAGSLSRLTGRPAGQIVSGRLQAMKRAGLVTFDTAAGWQIKQEELSTDGAI